MAQRTGNRVVRTGVRSAAGRFALRVGRDLRNIEVVDRGMTLAAHVFTSILPILIVVGALRATLEPQADAIFAEHLGFDDSTAEMLDKSLPPGERELRVIGVFGVVVLIIAATSFARALERSFRAIWRTPKVSIKFAWRWLVAIVAVVIGIALIVTTRIIVQGGGAIPVFELIAEIAIWGALWWIAGWIVINRRVSLRALLPGAVLAGVAFAIAGQVGRVVLPPILAEAAVRFGILGLAFSYIGWLLVLSCTLLIAATAGRVVYLTSTGQAWRRSVALPAGEARIGAAE